MDNIFVEKESTSKSLPVIKFGRYSDDEKGTLRDIEWIVLDAKDGNALVLSKYVLDTQPYHSGFRRTTWEKCSLRAWLNNEFLNRAFSESEQSRIIETSIHTNNNPISGTDGGADTVDRLFLLSIEDVVNESLGFSSEYRQPDPLRKCDFSDYATDRFAWGNDHEYVHYVEGNASAIYIGEHWWLRSPGSIQSSAAEVECRDGFVFCSGSDVDYKSNGVRPAMRIKLEA